MAHESALGAPPELAWLPVDKLDVDHAYQRTLDRPASQKLIQHIADNFSWMRFQAILATPAAAGRWLVIDGQHRAEAARRRGIAQVPAVVIAEVTTAEQAAAFVGANKDRVPISAQALFHARLAAGDADAATLKRLCDRAGIRILPYALSAKVTPAGQTSAVPALLALLRQHGAEIAGEAIAALGECYGRYHAALRSPTFLAAGRFLAEGGGAAGLRLALTRVGPEELEKAGARLSGSSRIPVLAARLRSASAPPAPRLAPRPVEPGPAPRPAAPVAARPERPAPVPRRAADQAEIDRFLAEKGATKLPGVGNPALSRVGELVWDKKLRKWTRPAAGEVPA